MNGEPSRVVALGRAARNMSYTRIPIRLESSNMRACIPSILVALTGCLPNAWAQEVTPIEFEPESAEFADAAAGYDRLWSEEGAHIVAALERITTLELDRMPIRAVVYEGPSFSGNGERPMRMRASYPPDTRRAGLVHELGHRLLTQLAPQDFDHHPVLFLFLYDVWVDLWGEEFAAAQVAIESSRRGIYDYAGAWNVALTLDANERAALWRDFLSRHRALAE